MKRDPDLCRAIMLSIEESPSEYVQQRSIELPSVEGRSIAAHVSLLLDDGLLVGQSEEIDPIAEGRMRRYLTVTARNDHNPSEVRLSNAEHEFLDLSRQSKAWSWTKDQAAKVPGMTFSMLVPMMKVYVRDQAAKLGVDLS